MASWWGDGKGWLGASVAAPLVLFVATICPTVAFGDSGELIAAAAGLGVAHPPGYPLYTLLAWLALQIPLGQPALSVNLLSALFGALTCGAVAWFIRRATGSAVAAVSAALALAVSSTFWQVSTVAEVYTLHLFFMIAMLSAAQAIGDTSGKARRTALLLAAAALGLGLAHHPTIVLAVPAALVLLLRRPRPPGAPAGCATGLPARLPARTLVVAAALVVVTPLVFDLTLMWRARLDPPSNWGFATDLRSLWIHISATTYRHLDLGWIGLLRGAAWSKFGMLLREELTPMMWPLALMGIFGIPRGGHGALLPRIRLALALLVGASAIFGLRYATEDVAVFYLPVFVGLAVAHKNQPVLVAVLDDLERASLLMALISNGRAVTIFDPAGTQYESSQILDECHFYAVIAEQTNDVADSGMAPALWICRMDLSAEQEADFNQWYDSNFITKLESVPDFIRRRTFRTVRGEVPQYAIVAEIDIKNVFKIPRFAEQLEADAMMHSLIFLMDRAHQDCGLRLSSFNSIQP